eukprot:CAMPEP_0181317752 /NCGR_PEP_ID=MMETSP1101-20121128/16637_1 /TAXON_ID=46948 /ORGANISM="Rhodomonas abbreviata, Strain Caron Lab Isolate" /LENGTH=265 /DNA_ID=CAMNT_0023425169 /DNA_START=23 /DNA_END=820 /DNA_ORIENTATION=-
MGRGPRKHLKRMDAPKHWMLDKMGGIFAPKPSAGPHKMRECLPLVIVLRNRLKYALDAKEVRTICSEKQVYVDGKLRTDSRYPLGLMDSLSIPASGDHFRVLYDTKGRFVLERIEKDEANFKLVKVVGTKMGKKKTPTLSTHDGRTVRFPDPLIKVDDTVKLDLKTGKIVEHLPYELGKVCLTVRGNNTGRVGKLVHKDRHLGSFDIVTLRDAENNTFTTRLSNIMIIGDSEGPAIKLPKGNGVRRTILEETAARMERREKNGGM